MEIATHESKHLFPVVTDVGTERTVVIRTQAFYYAVNHRRAEDIMLFEHSTLALKAISTGSTAVGQLGKRREFVGILLPVYVHVHVSTLGNLKGIVHLKAMTAGDSKACNELVYIGRAVR